MNSGVRPPAGAAWLLEKILPKALREEILGDLAETFQVYTNRFGAKYARRWYWKQLFHRDHWHLRREGRAWRLPGAATHAGSHSLWHGLGLDLKYVHRSLRRSPLFVITVVTTLALSIGATIAVFSLVHAVVFTPLPYSNPHELALLWNRLDRVGIERAPIASADVVDFRAQSETFSGFAFANSNARASLGTGDESWMVSHARVTQNLFALLGVRPALGRFFSGEDSLTIPVVVSDALWRRVFNADSSTVGRAVTLNGTSVTIIGVTDPGFQLKLPPEAGFPRTIDVWTPTTLDASRGVRSSQRIRDRDSDDTGIVIGRVIAGVVLTQAQAEMDALAARQRRSYQWHGDVGAYIDVMPMHANVIGSARGSIVLLSAAVAAVLAIACINVANLLLTRAMRRRREIKARLALGASTGRITRLLLLESTVLAILGGVGGIVLARFAVAALVANDTDVVGITSGVTLNTTVVLFAIGTTLSTAVMFGLAPVVISLLPSSRNLALGRDTVSSSTRQVRVRGALVVAEVAASVALAMTAGLLIRSFQAMQSIDPGFDASNVVTFDATLRNPARHGGPRARTQFVRQVIEGLEALPGVNAASLVSRLPLDGRSWTNQFAHDFNGETERGEANFVMISSKYFEVMSTPVLAGRTFNRGDDNQNVRVAIVDEAFASGLGITGAGLLGRYIDFPLDGQRVQAEVVGVVESIRYEDLRFPSRGTIYVPYRHEASRDVAFVVRAHESPESLIRGIPAVVSGLDPLTPIQNIRRLDDVVKSSVASSTFLLIVIGVFAGMATLLAVVGVYGVIAYAVGLREREIAVRLALGARETSVVRDILARGMGLIGLGLVIGTVVLLSGGRVVGRVLFGVQTADPVTLLFTAVAIAAVSFVACLVPALRASRLGPSHVLRLD